jgi:hypothetical protein
MEINLIKKLICATMLLFSGIVAAAPFAYAQLNFHDRVVLHDDQKNCPDGSNYMEWHGVTAGSPRVVRGCWKVVLTNDGPRIYIEDEDNDRGMLPLEAFTPVQHVLLTR